VLTTHVLVCWIGSTSPAGYNIGYNMGKTAGASIAHLHQHVIPRFRNEIGISDLLAGKRVLVEDPRVTAIASGRSWLRPTCRRQCLLQQRQKPLRLSRRVS